MQFLCYHKQSLTTVGTSIRPGRIQDPGHEQDKCVNVHRGASLWKGGRNPAGKKRIHYRLESCNLPTACFKTAIGVFVYRMACRPI